MKCPQHPERDLDNMCNKCGVMICTDCTVNIEGTPLCRNCVANHGESNPRPEPRPRPIPFPLPERHILWGLVFLFSFLPGANYMYMGLIKRGLAVMSGFFLIIFLLSNSSGSLALIFAFSIPIYVVASFFDGFNIRRRINRGETVRDDVGEALHGLLNNKTMRNIILVALVIILVVTVLNVVSAILSHAIPILLIGLIVFVLVKRKK